MRVNASLQASQIQDQTCPECGARMVSLAQTIKHTNGQWFEEAKYECGRRAAWVPNYRRLELQASCRGSVAFTRTMTAVRTTADKVLHRLDELSLEADITAYHMLRECMSSLERVSAEDCADRLARFEEAASNWSPDNSPDVEAGDLIVAADGSLYEVTQRTGCCLPWVRQAGSRNGASRLLTGWRKLEDVKF